MNKTYFTKEARTARKEAQAEADAAVLESNNKLFGTIGKIFGLTVAGVVGVAAVVTHRRRKA